MDLHLLNLLIKFIHLFFKSNTFVSKILAFISELVNIFALLRSICSNWDEFRSESCILFPKDLYFVALMQIARFECFILFPKKLNCLFNFFLCINFILFIDICCFYKFLFSLLYLLSELGDDLIILSLVLFHLRHILGHQRFLQFGQTLFNLSIFWALNDWDLISQMPIFFLQRVKRMLKLQFLFHQFLYQLHFLLILGLLVAELYLTWWDSELIL